MSLRRFPAPPLGAAGDTVVLDDEASHHMLRVTRVPRGTAVELFDGQRSAPATLHDVQDGRAVCVLDGPPVAAGAQPDRVVAVALLKGPAFELALRMATELGATAIWPVLAARSVAKGERRERWERVLTGAARQCGRSAPPVLAPLRPLADVVAARPPGLPAFVCAPGAAARTAPPAAMVFIGPEGGWTPDELADLTAAGVAPLGLGPHVLRADTAVAAALARLG